VAAIRCWMLGLRPKSQSIIRHLLPRVKSAAKESRSGGRYFFGFGLKKSLMNSGQSQCFFSLSASVSVSSSAGERYDLRHTYASWSLAADVPVAKLSKMMGTSIGQIEDTYHRFLKGDEARYGSALDSYGAAATA
jgi:integrase